jgi:hypothetical protein
MPPFNIIGLNGDVAMALIAPKLAAAHFIAWTLVQRRDWRPEAASVNRSLWRGVGGAAVYAGLSLLFLSWDRHTSTDLYGLIWLVLTTAAIRLVIDSLGPRLVPRSWWGFLGLQAVELWAICGTAALALDLIGLPNGLCEFCGFMRGLVISPQTYSILATYSVSLGLGGALVRLVTSLLRRTEEEDAGTEGAGSIIGILERLLVTSFVLFWPQLGAAAIGLIFSAKSIARFPEMGKDPRFAEYYLVGTLTSFTVAIAAGMIARTYLLG